MKVLGQLEVAQLENIASVGPTPAPTGRIYIDITNPLAGVPMFYNGTAWKQLLTGQATPTIVSNSGKSVTVDWSTGLIQQVKLTDNCVIKFANPVSGQRHLLIVTQNSTATSGNGNVYNFTFDMSDQLVQDGLFQPQMPVPFSQSKSFSWFYAPGIQASDATGSNKVSTQQTNGSLVGSGSNASISPDGQWLAYAASVSPYQQWNKLYKGSPQNQSLLGLKNSITPGTGTANGCGICFTAQGRAAFLCASSTPFIQGFPLDDRGYPTSAGNAYANPGTLPAGAANTVCAHPSGSYVLVGHSTTPFMSCYPVNNNGFGTILANPVSLPASAVVAAAFSPQGDYLAVGTGTTPFLQVYAFTDTAGVGAFGAVAANPSVLPAGSVQNTAGRTVAWRPQGDFIAVGLTVTPFLYIVPFNRASGAFGTPLTISLGLTVFVGAVAWSPCGTYLLIANGLSAGYAIYDFSTQVPVAITLAATPPNTQCFDALWNLDGNSYFVITASGVMTQYSAPRRTKNYLRILE